ncbi:MAG: hypothetical protein WCS03_05570 [Bacteroidota bacterium]
MKKKLNIWFFTLLIAVIVILPGCATILGGSKSITRVKQGTPPNAKVFYNGAFIGDAPTNVRVPKSAKQGNSYIEVKADGFETSKISMTRKVSVGYTILDICFGLLPLGIDFATGNIYKPRPNRIDYFLEKKDSNK